jgi:7-cyano-7-deazaguanine reductase
MNDIPLGKSASYPTDYAPDVLYAVPRQEARAGLGLGPELPFTGVDIWNAWELTWLSLSGLPVVATGVITVPADSPNIIESKSLKLYLNSLSMTRFDSARDVTHTIRDDLSRVAGATVDVDVALAEDSSVDQIAALPGICIDYLDAPMDQFTVEPGLLQTADETVTNETLHSHLLRSNCPVTNQPDTGSIMIQYTGPEIVRETLLRYIVSYRQHSDFHEACVERIFTDLKDGCRCTELTVYARFNRRGGLDINPYRSNSGNRAENLRLWRQ